MAPFVVGRAGLQTVASVALFAVVPIDLQRLVIVALFVELEAVVSVVAVVVQPVVVGLVVAEVIRCDVVPTSARCRTSLRDLSWLVLHSCHPVGSRSSNLPFGNCTILCRILLLPNDRNL